MLGYATIPLAFILGFALTRASTCTVAATMRLVTKGKADWLIGIMVAVGWSGVTLLLLSVFFPAQINTPEHAAITLPLYFGAAIMGLGAFLNRACFIGSIGHISSGNLSFLLTFLGLIVARKLSEFRTIADIAKPTYITTPPPDFGLLYWFFTLGFIVLASFGLLRIARKRQEAIVALSVMGVAAALIFSSQPDWSYEARIGRLISGKGFSERFIIEYIVIALFSGAIISSILKDRFHLHFLSVKQTMMNFAGGVFMGMGALFVPGGNDSLLLWSIPGHAIHGVIAYALMVVVVAVLVVLSNRFMKQEQ